MSSSWLDRWLQRSSALSLSRRRSRRRPTRRALALERLEDRTVPSTSIPLSAFSWKPIGPDPIATFFGPVTGRVAALAADPNDANTIYIAAAGGGVWKTTDGGNTWAPKTDHVTFTDSLGAQEGVPEFMGAIAIAPSNTQTIYAGTGESNNSLDSFYGRGVLKSTDGGTTWTDEQGNPGLNEFDRRTISKIIVNPTDPNTVFVAVSGPGSNGLPGDTGIWKTTDGGTSWVNTTSSITSTASFTDLIIDPANSQILYAAAGSITGDAANGVYKTTNGGTSWSLLTGRLPSGPTVGRVVLAISQNASPQTIYASLGGTNAIGSSGFGNLFKFMKSTNGGLTWADLTASTPDYFGGQGWYDTTIAVDPKDSTRVYVGGSFQVLETTNGGNAWSDVSAFPFGPHPDHHGIGFDARGHLLDGNDGGIWRLDNPNPANPQWSDLNANLQITQFTGVALDPTTSNIAYGGSQDNGTEKFIDPFGWSLIQGGDGGFVRVDAGHPNTIYHTFFYPGGGFLERSDDGGNTWTAKVSGINVADPGRFYVPYIIDSGDSSRLILGTDHVYESLDRADSWTKVGTFTFPSVIDSVAAAGTDVNTIYASSAGHVFKTTNAHDPINPVVWTQLTDPAPNSAGVVYNDIKVDPVNPKIVFVVAANFRDTTGGGQVWRTTDGGLTWTDITSNLPDSPTNTVLLDPWSKVLMVGNDIGVYASNDLGATWRRLHDNADNSLPYAQVVDLELNTVELQLNVRGYVVGAGTHGRGMFEIATTHFGVTPSVSSVPAQTPFSVTVTALDAFEQLIAGYTGSYTGTVHFSSDDPGATLPADYSFTTQDNDVHTFSGIVFLKPGVHTITVTDTIDNATLGSTTITVVQPVATHYSVTGPSRSTVNAPFTVTVTALDGSDNVASGYTGTVHFTSTDGAAVLPADYTFGVADQGVHTFVNGVILKTVGVQFVTATDKAANTIFGSAGVVVSASAAARFAIAAPGSTTAGVPFSITVTALDQFGGVASNYAGTIRFSSSDLAAILPANYTFTAIDQGVHTFTNLLTLETAGTRSITATDSINSFIVGTADVSVNAATASQLSLTVPSATSAGAAFSITVTLLDAFSNVAAGYLGTVNFASSDPGAVLPTSYTFLNTDQGVHTFVGATILKKAGLENISATDSITASITDTKNITVMPSIINHFLMQAPTASVAGAGFVFTVTAQDSFNNTVTGYTGTVQVTSSDSQATLPANYTFLSSEQGVHTFSSGVILRTSGNQTVTVADTSSGFLSGTASVTVTSAVATHLSLTVPPVSSAGASFSVTVTSLDAFNNTATGYLGTVKFTSSDAAAILPGNFTFSTTDLGVHTFSNAFTLDTAGPQTITATDTVALQIKGSGSVAVSSAGVARFVTQAPATTTAGSPFTVTVTALDAFNNTVTGYSGALQFTSSDAAATVPPIYFFTSGDQGVHTFTNGLTLRTSGSQSVTAFLPGSPSINGTATVAVAAAAASHLTVATPANVTAGAAFTFTVTALDLFNNVANGYTGTVGFTSSDATATLPGTYTFLAGDQGVHTFTLAATLFNVGAQTLTATDTVTASINGTGTPIVNTFATHLVLSAPATSTAGTPFSLTVTVLDGFNNTVFGYQGTIHFTHGGVGSVPGDYTFTTTDAGMHTFANAFTLNTAGNETITATDTVTPSVTGSTGVAVSASAAVQFTLSGPGSATAGSPVSVTLTALDTFGNAASGYRGTVSFTSSDSAALLPGNFTFASGDAGVHTFAGAVTFITSGPQTITATDTVTTALSATTVVPVSPGPAAVRFQEVLPASTIAGNPFSLTVTALDASNAVASSYTGTVHFTSTDAVGTLPADYTFAISDHGVHTFGLVVLRRAGTQRISATDTAKGSITGSATMAVSAAAANHFDLLAPLTTSINVPFNVTVTALDAFNNTDLQYAGTIHFASSDSKANLPADYSFQSADQGVHRFSGPTLHTAGTFSLTVTDTGNATITGAAQVKSLPVLLVTGTDAGGGPEVKVFDPVQGTVKFDFFAYDPRFKGGVRVAIGDVNGDGVPDIVTAPGPGGGPDIKVFDGVTGLLIKEFFAYAPSFVGGINVAVGDINGDGFADIITAADAGGGPHVQVFSGKDGSLLRSFYAYDPVFHGGVRVASADVNGDGKADIITAPGAGGGPDIRVFSGNSGGKFLEFMAYDPKFVGGVYVAAGDTNGDGRADIITGAGAGGGPNVKVFSGLDATLLKSFYAYDPHFTGGVRVGFVSDLNGDGEGEIITAAGPGGGPHTEIFDGLTLARLDSFFAYDPAFAGGVFVGGQ